MCKKVQVLIVVIDVLKMIFDVGVVDMEGGLPVQVDNPPRSRVKGAGRRRG
jgi:hypothetical protein